MYYFCVAIIILAGIFALFLEHPDIHFGLAEWWVDVCFASPKEHQYHKQKKCWGQNNLSAEKEKYQKIYWEILLKV